MTELTSDLCLSIKTHVNLVQSSTRVTKAERDRIFRRTFIISQLHNSIAFPCARQCLQLDEPLSSTASRSYEEPTEHNVG